MRLLAYFLIFGWLFFPNYFQILRPRVSPAPLTPLTPLTPFNRVIIPRGAGWAGRGRICTYRDICQHTEHRGADQQRSAATSQPWWELHWPIVVCCPQHKIPSSIKEIKSPSNLTNMRKVMNSVEILANWDGQECFVSISAVCVITRY